METPVISQKQIRKTLSSKKATPKSIRTVLTTPRENFRPIISGKDEEDFIALFKTTFGKKTPLMKVPWNLIKEVPKEKRKEIRKKYRLENKSDVIVQTEKEKSVLTGINSVIKGLEKNQLNALILSPDVMDLRPLYDFIIRLCKLSNTSIIILPELSNITHDYISIRTLALGFLKMDENGKLSTLIQKINELSNLPTKKSLETSIKEYIEESNNANLMEVDTVDITSIREKNENQIDRDHKVMNVSSEKNNKFYLYRDSTKTRVFVPSQTVVAKPKEEKFVNDDFIAFSTDLVSEDNERDVKFRPMKVKKITKNVNRKQKWKNKKKV